MFRKKPGARSLVAVSCVLSVLDAAIIALMKNPTMGLPFCAVSALSMTFSIWGEYWRCGGQRSGYRVLTSSSNLYTVTGEKGLTAKNVALLKSRSSLRGFVRRSEEEDYSGRIFGVLVPVILSAALVMGVVASIGHGTAKNFFHIVSVMIAASSAFSATSC